jgi:hypothetical protein
MYFCFQEITASIFAKSNKKQTNIFTAFFWFGFMPKLIQPISGGLEHNQTNLLKSLSPDSDTSGEINRDCFLCSPQGTDEK